MKLEMGEVGRGWIWLQDGADLRCGRAVARRCRCIDRRDGHGSFGMGDIDKDVQGDEEGIFYLTQFLDR
jgi:hypothetical protein